MAKEVFTMIVYRFEKNGIGPYVGGMGPISRFSLKTNHKAQKKAQHILKSLPVDFDNWGKAHRNKTMLYGCSSKLILQAYFGFRFKPLFDAGYRIKKYLVPDNEVIEMGCVCAFPVKYHKLKTKRKLERTVTEVRGF